MKKIFKKDGESSSLKERLLRLLNKEGFYVAIFLCITLVATLVVYFANNNVERDVAEDNQAVEETQDIAQDEIEGVNQDILEEEPEVEETQAPVTDEQDEEVEEESAENTPIEEDTKDPLSNFVSPVTSDEVVMAFSFGVEPVFSKTLREFTSDHSGVDLKAELGEDVKAALDGKVIKIYKDAKLGQTIIIEHSNNIETRYSNLDPDVNVTLNQSVKAGDVIGKVGNTATFESEEEPHLHFEVWQDGKCVDPTQYLK